jgi:hypothetical protein
MYRLGRAFGCERSGAEGRAGEMERQIGQVMVIQATCRCGRQFLIEVSDYRAGWMLALEESQWPYRSGYAYIRLAKGLEPTRETFLAIVSTRLIPRLDGDMWIVDMEEGCRDHDFDFGNLTVGKVRRQHSHLVVPVNPQEIPWLVDEEGCQINTEALLRCSGGLREGWESSGEALEGDR